MPVVRRSRRRQHVAADGAHAAVGVAHAGAEEEVEDAGEHRVADVAVEPGHRARLDAAHAVAHHEVGALVELLDEARDVAEVVGEVGVGHHDVVAGGGREAGQVGAAVAAPRLVHDERAGARARARRCRRPTRCRRRSPRPASPGPRTPRARLATQRSIDAASFRQGMTTDTLTVLGLSRSATETRVVCSTVLRGTSLLGPGFEPYERAKMEEVAPPGGDGSGTVCQPLPPPMRICLVYDCLFPYTVGGAERWYRNLGERLAAEGHEVTYLTLRQWERGERGEVPGVRVVAVGPRMELYADGGRRRILPPLVVRLGVLWHLLRHGAATTWCTPPRSPTSRCWRRPRCGAGATGWWWTGTRSGAASTGASTWARSAAASATPCRRSACACPSAPSASRSSTRGGCAEERRERRADRARGRVRGRARAAASRSRRSRWWCSPAATSRRSGCRRSCPRWRWRASASRSCAARSSATAPSAARCCGSRSRAGPRRRARGARLRGRRAGGGGAVAGALHGAAVAPRGLRPGRGRGGGARHAERGGGRPRQRGHRAVSEGENGFVAPSAVARGPGRRDRARARRGATRCASARRPGSRANARAAVARELAASGCSRATRRRARGR